MSFDRKDFASGSIFVAVGLLYGGMTLQSLAIGETLNMGPGYFPLLLSGLLVVLGSAILMRSFWRADVATFGTVPWRALLMLSLATLIFARFLDQLGMLAAVFVTAFVASFASRQTKPHSAALVSLCIAVFCTLVFKYGLSLPLPLFGSWFSG